MFFPGDEFADKTDHVYFAVNEDRRSSREAIVTEDAAPLSDTFFDVKPASTHRDSSVTCRLSCVRRWAACSAYAGDAVVPGHIVRFALGSQKCSAETDLDGTASCSLIVHGSLGKTKLEVNSGATRAYLAAESSSNVDVQISLPHPIGLPPIIHVPIPHPPAPRPTRGPGGV
jgi:hypothetical protein